MASLILPSSNAVTKGRLGGKQFEYNPTSFVDKIGVRYSEIKSPGISYPIIAYEGGDTRTLQFELYLNGRMLADTLDEGSEKVQQWINHLHSFLPPAGVNRFFKPPDLEFAFGTFVKTTKLRDMPITREEFMPDLRPLTVRISLTLIVLQ